MNDTAFVCVIFNVLTNIFGSCNIYSAHRQGTVLLPVMLCKLVSASWFCMWHASTEEIRKSIETLDRILDEYDNGVGSSKELQTEKRFVPQKADAAAHMLASCIQTAGNHRLRKRSGSSHCFVGLLLESVMLCEYIKWLFLLENVSYNVLYSAVFCNLQILFTSNDWWIKLLLVITDYGC